MSSRSRRILARMGNVRHSSTAAQLRSVLGLRWRGQFALMVVPTASGKVGILARIFSASEFGPSAMARRLAKAR